MEDLGFGVVVFKVEGVSDVVVNGGLVIVGWGDWVNLGFVIVVINWIVVVVIIGYFD